MRGLHLMTNKYNLSLDTASSNCRIKKKNHYAQSSTYVILNYDKNFMSFDDTNTGLYRSVVFSYPEKNVVCFSHPKSIPFSVFTNKYPEIKENIYINEAIEGLSINLFYDKKIMKWNIATKNSIGGKYWFYGKKTEILSTPITFLEMFLEGLREDTTKEQANVSVDCCYNFVLQHPANSIILPVKSAKLYLIGVHLIRDSEVEYIPQSKYQVHLQHLNGIILFPNSYTVTDFSELPMDKIHKGYMMTNVETGERTNIKNKQYEDLKSLICIKPSIQYQFLCLNRIGRDKVDEYLKIFPKLKKEFYVLRNLYDQFTKKVHESYLKKYVYKEKDIILEKYRSHIYKIHHTIYLLKLNKNTIARTNYREVKRYFDNMEPRELIYILNWDCRNL